MSDAVETLNELVQRGLIEVVKIANGEPTYRLAAGVIVIPSAPAHSRRRALSESDGGQTDDEVVLRVRPRSGRRR